MGSSSYVSTHHPDVVKVDGARLGPAGRNVHSLDVLADGAGLGVSRLAVQGVGVAVGLATVHAVVLAGIKQTAALLGDGVRQPADLLRSRQVADRIGDHTHGPGVEDLCTRKWGVGGDVRIITVID
jgi:hypothetical protein